MSYARDQRKKVVRMEKLRFIIEMDQTTGQVQINGPIQNKMLCFGLLEIAKDAVREYARQHEGQIQPAPLGLVTKFSNNQ